MASNHITITDGTRTVTLLDCLEFSILPETVGERFTMASGRTVEDISGEKITLNVPTGWLSVSDLTKLRAMIRQHGVLTVTYPDLDGDTTDEFYVDQPEYKAFRYGDDGVSQWCGVTLAMTQYGVEEST